jgi:hypothetical protein
MRAELARRISRDTGHPLAKAELLEIAARLDAEADRIDTSPAIPAMKLATTRLERATRRRPLLREDRACATLVLPIAFAVAG